jgi:hypothetical protein
MPRIVAFFLTALLPCASLGLNLSFFRAPCVPSVHLRPKGATTSVAKAVRILFPSAASPQRRPAAQRLGLGLGLLVACGQAVLSVPRAAVAMGAPVSHKAVADAYRVSLVLPACLWCSLFIFSAALHAAEISITTLYPWKVWLM